MRRVFISVFSRQPIRGEILRELRDLASEIPRFFAISHARDTRELLGSLGIIEAHRHVPTGFPALPSSLDDYSSASLAGSLAGHAISRLVLQSYPRRHTESTYGIGVVADQEHLFSVAVWSKRFVCRATKLTQREMMDLLRHLPHTLSDSKLWNDSHLNLANELAPLYSDRDLKVRLLRHDGVMPAPAATDAPNPAILCGSFNPLHIAHVRLLQSGVAQLHEAGLGDVNLTLAPQGAMELTVRNPGKPAFEMDELLDRLLQFGGRLDVFASNAPYFSDKASLLPRTTWITGIDTAERVLDASFYNNDPRAIERTLRTVETNQCSFLVAGRAMVNEQWRAIDSLSVPHRWKHLFHPLDEGDSGFRLDISSTQLRNIGFTL